MKKGIRISTEPPAAPLPARTRRVRVLSRLMDEAIPIPGTGRRIGLDAIVGLIPGVGDLIGGAASGYIILEAARANVPTITLVKMLANVGVDTLVGVIPAAGDLFDAAWKANTRNVALLEQHLSKTEALEKPGEKKAAVGASIVAMVVLAAIVLGGVALGIFAGRMLWRQFNQ